MFGSVNLERDIHLTGQITYLMGWLLLHRIDGWRVKVALGSPISKWSDWRNRVEDTIKGIDDLAAHDRATATALELRWMGLERENLLAAKAEYENVEHEYRKLMAANPDNDITAGLALSYAEFTKFSSPPDWDEAKRQAHLALEHGLEKHLVFFELWASIELLDIERLQGGVLDWRRLAELCEKMKYPLGLAYVLLIAKSGGESVTAPRHLLTFLRRNGCHQGADLLAGQYASTRPHQGIRLAFPGVFTLY
jgi:hypothetical protein